MSPSAGTAGAAGTSLRRRSGRSRAPQPGRQRHPVPCGTPAAPPRPRGHGIALPRGCPVHSAHPAWCQRPASPARPRAACGAAAGPGAAPGAAPGCPQGPRAGPAAAGARWRGETSRRSRRPGRAAPSCGPGRVPQGASSFPLVWECTGNSTRARGTYRSPAHCSCCHPPGRR